MGREGKPAPPELVIARRDAGKVAVQSSLRSSDGEMRQMEEELVTAVIPATVTSLTAERKQ